MGFEVGFDFWGCCPELVKLVKLIKFVNKIYFDVRVCP